MKRYVYILVAVLTIGLLSHVLARDAAAVDIFVKMEGIESEFRALKGYEGWIDAINMSHKVSQPAASTFTSGGSTGRAIFEDIVVAKNLDKTSPTLNLLCANGQRIRQVIIEFVIPDSSGVPKTMMKYELRDVIITSIGITAGKAARPVEEVTLNYATIRWEYTFFDQRGIPVGSVERSWSVVENKGG